MALDAINGNSIAFKQSVRPNLKTSQNFTSKPEEVDEEKSNAAKWMIGATALVSVIGLGIAVYKGKFRKGVQNFSDGAEHNNLGIEISFYTKENTAEGIEKIRTFMEEHKEAVYEKLRNEGMDLLKKAKGEYDDIIKRAEKYANEYSDITKIEGDKYLNNDGTIRSVFRDLEDGKATVRYFSYSGKSVDSIMCTFPEGYHVAFYREKNGAMTFNASKKDSDIKVSGREHVISRATAVCNNEGTFLNVNIENGKEDIKKMWKPTKVNEYNFVESYGHEICMSNKRIDTKEEDVREYLGITE